MRIVKKSFISLQNVDTGIFLLETWEVTGEDGKCGGKDGEN
jgi:hypothetical protein